MNITSNNEKIPEIILHIFFHEFHFNFFHLIVGALAKLISSRTSESTGFLTNLLCLSSLVVISHASYIFFSL